MYYKLSAPTLFSRDYVFQDNRYFQFYTPSFLLLVNITGAIAGDYFHGVALLQAPILAAYLAAAYGLFWQASRSRAIALIFALLSVVGVSVVIDFWRANSLGSMLPRTAALPIIVLAALLLVRYLMVTDTRHFSGRAWRHWLILGLLVGAAANFHPTTGISLALVAGLVGIIERRRSKHPSFLFLSVMAIGTLVTAAPIVLNVAGGTRTSLTLESFETFVNAFQARISMPPYSGSRLKSLTQEWLYLLGFLWLLLTLVFWILARPNRRSWAALIFVGIQIAYTWLLIKNADAYLDTFIVVVAGALFVWRWWAKDEGREMLWYEMIAAIVGVSLVLPLLLRVGWLEWEVWSLTTIVAELPRGARLLTIPLYITGARLAVHIAQQPMGRDTKWLLFMALLSVLVPPSVWHLVLVLIFVIRERLRAYPPVYAGAVTAVSASIIYMIVTRTDGTLAALAAGIYVMLAIGLLTRLHVPQMAGVILLGAMAAIVALTALNLIAPISFTNDSPWYTFALRGSPEFVTFLLGGAGGLGLWMVLNKPSHLAPLPQGEGRKTERVGWLSRVLPHDLFGWLVVALIGVMAVQAVGMVRFSLRTSDPTTIPALVQAGQWAEANTDLDALFLDTVGDGSEFRLWSLRSVTHGWKELGLVGYARPLDLAPMLERYRRIMAESETEAGVLAIAAELDADYIIRSADAPLELAEAYRNDEVVIYRIAP